MKKRKFIVTPEQLNIIAESEFNKIRKEELDDMIGEPTDRKIQYPSRQEVNAIKMGGGSKDVTDTVDVKEMQSPPNDLIEYLDKLEEAKSILSKIGAREIDKKIKDKIYGHYDKVHKVAFEFIKEFGVVH